MQRHRLCTIIKESCIWVTWYITWRLVGKPSLTLTYPWIEPILKEVLKVLPLIEEPSEIPCDVQVVSNEEHEGIKLLTATGNSSSQKRLNDFKQTISFISIKIYDSLLYCRSCRQTCKFCISILLAISQRQCCFDHIACTSKIIQIYSARFY